MNNSTPNNLNIGFEEKHNSAAPEMKCITPLRIVHVDHAPDGFLADRADDVDFYRAYQNAKIPGFSDIGYCEVYRGDARVSVVPWFFMNFNLNTMLPEGLLKRCTAWARVSVICIGHPASDMRPIQGEISEEVLTAVNTALAHKASILAYKGFTSDMPLSGFVRISGLPDARLTLRGDYWSELSHSTRKSLKKKLKVGAALRVEELEHISRAQAEQLHRLYLNTYMRAATKFDCLNVEYFMESAPISRYVLFYEADRLIGFVQLSRKKPQMVVRYGGLDYERSDKYGTYFLLSLKAIEIALRDGFSEIDFGSTSYHFKRMLGCQLIENYIYFRHRNRKGHFLLRAMRGLLEPTVAELE